MLADVYKSNFQMLTGAETTLLVNFWQQASATKSELYVSTTEYQKCVLPHTFCSPFSGTTQASQYQKGKTSLDFAEARDSEWQWNQLGHMQVCTSLQTDNHASNPPLSFYRPDAIPATQPTVSQH